MAKYRQIKRTFATVESAEWKQITYPAGCQLRQAPFAQITQLLAEYNIPIAPYKITDQLNDAIAFLEQEQKIVVKIANEEVIHKSDFGLVRLNITTMDQLTAVFSDFKAAARQVLDPQSKIHYLLQKMVPGGIEMILGSSLDLNFGPVIMFGLGGINVEMYRDIVFRLLPLSDYDAESMIEELKAAKIFDGYRGSLAVEKSKITALIKNFSRMIYENPHITEMDINPLIWPSGYDHPVVVDCRMTMHE